MAALIQTLMGRTHACGYLSSHVMLSCSNKMASDITSAVGKSKVGVEKADMIALLKETAGTNQIAAEKMATQMQKEIVESIPQETMDTLAEKAGEQARKVAQEGAKEAGKQAAEKLIGATWDVGHINMIRRQGFGKEDIIKEAEKIAPVVKHIHLSDNFGFEHTELPMGMGNVPIKEIMKKLLALLSLFVLLFTSSAGCIDIYLFNEWLVPQEDEE